MITSLAWEDLLSRSFRLGGRGSGALDCAGVAEEILIRCGLIERGEVIFPDYATLAQAMSEGAAQRILEESTARFERIGTHPRDARQVGDFAVCDEHRLGWGTHVTILVQGLPHRTWLTARQDGAVKSHTDAKVLRPLGIYRVVPR